MPSAQMLTTFYPQALDNVAPRADNEGSERSSRREQP
jgi:hypothetical protein